MMLYMDLLDNAMMLLWRTHTTTNSYRWLRLWSKNDLELVFWSILVLFWALLIFNILLLYNILLQPICELTTVKHYPMLSDMSLWCCWIYLCLISDGVIVLLSKLLWCKWHSWSSRCSLLSLRGYDAMLLWWYCDAKWTQWGLNLLLLSQRVGKSMRNLLWNGVILWILPEW